MVVSDATSRLPLVALVLLRNPFLHPLVERSVAPFLGWMALEHFLEKKARKLSLRAVLFFLVRRWIVVSSGPWHPAETARAGAGVLVGGDVARGRSGGRSSRASHSSRVRTVSRRPAISSSIAAISRRRSGEVTFEGRDRPSLLRQLRAA